MKTLYLHGLGSSGRSNTAKMLRRLDVELIAPDYAPQHYRDAIEALSRLIEAERPGRVIGTSMGGYYALKLYEAFGLPSVAVNPCYDPARLLTPYLERPAWDYANDSPIHFDRAMLDAFEQVSLPGAQPGLRVVIGRNDELIAAQGQREFCERLGIDYVETGWGHRVEDAGQLLALFLASPIPPAK